MIATIAFLLNRIPEPKRRELAAELKQWRTLRRSRQQDFIPDEATWALAEEIVGKARESAEAPVVFDSPLPMREEM